MAIDVSAKKSTLSDRPYYMWNFILKKKEHPLNYGNFKLNEHVSENTHADTVICRQTR